MTSSWQHQQQQHQVPNPSLCCWLKVIKQRRCGILPTAGWRSQNNALNSLNNYVSEVTGQRAAAAGWRSALHLLLTVKLRLRHAEDLALAIWLNWDVWAHKSHTIFLCGWGLRWRNVEGRMKNHINLVKLVNARLLLVGGQRSTSC